MFSFVGNFCILAIFYFFCATAKIKNKNGNGFEVFFSSFVKEKLNKFVKSRARFYLGCSKNAIIWNILITYSPTGGPWL